MVEQIKCIGRDPEIIAETARQVHRQTEHEIRRLEGERDGLKRQLGSDYVELRRLAHSAGNGERTAGMADVQEQIRIAEQRLTEIDSELVTLASRSVNETEVTQALAEFDRVWDALAPREQARVLELLIERVEFDGHRGNMSITLHPTGIKSLADELAAYEEDAA